MFKNGTGLLNGNAGKPRHKISELCPVFEVLE